MKKNKSKDWFSFCNSNPSMRFFHWVFAIAFIGLIAGCNKSSTQNSKSSSSRFGAELLLPALRGVSLRANLSLPPSEDVDELLAAGDPIATYNSLVEKYVKSENLRPALMDYYRTIFGMSGDADNPEDDDPARLATYIIMNDSDYCDLVTAKFKIDSTGAKVDGQDGGAPLNSLGGFMTLPAWLKFYKGNKFLFNYVREVARVAECYEYPDPDSLGAWTESQVAKKYLSRDGGSCFNCHKTMNVHRSVWYKYDGANFNDGKEKGTDLYGHESTTFLNKPVDEPRGTNPKFTFLRDMVTPADFGEQICEAPRFNRCGARRFLGFALGYSGGFSGPGIGKTPFDFDASDRDGDRELLEKWTTEFVATHNRKVRPFLIAFFESEDYIIRANNGAGL